MPHNAGIKKIQPVTEEEKIHLIVKAQPHRITYVCRTPCCQGSWICREKFANAAVVSDMTAFLPGVKHHSYSWARCRGASGSRALRETTARLFYPPAPSCSTFSWQIVTCHDANPTCFMFKSIKMIKCVKKGQINTFELQQNSLFWSCCFSWGSFHSQMCCNLQKSPVNQKHGRLSLFL